MTATIRILFLEDLPADAEMAKRELKKAGIEFVGKVVETENDFRNELNGFLPDIIISDYSLPSFDGMSALKIVRKHTHYIPFIILTGSMNEETAVNCMKSGANDYVIKEQIKRLPYAVHEAIEANKIRLEKEKILEELIEAKEKAEESDRLKTAFLANMSHEIRTPMNGILGFTNLLANPQLSGAEKAEYIDIIQKSGQRMLNTVNDIIEISKIETGQVKPFINPVNICKVIEDLVVFFEREAEQKGLGFNYDKQTDPGTILTDLTKFTSIMSNLIKNALKYTDKGSVPVGCKEGENYALFFVRNTGIGIPANRQKAVFNRFEQADIGDTRAFQGSGLGLSIAKSYVEMLGGEIWVESE